MSMAMKHSGRKSGKNISQISHGPMFSADEAPQNKPKLLVFDLDNTIWTPELYQIRKSNIQAWRDIRLFDGAEAICADLAQNGDAFWSDTEFAIASRTNKGDIAESLLAQFEAGSIKLN